MSEYVFLQPALNISQVAVRLQRLKRQEILSLMQLPAELPAQDCSTVTRVLCKNKSPTLLSVTIQTSGPTAPVHLAVRNQESCLVLSGPDPLFLIAANH
jgi:hypothetical protein